MKLLTVIMLWISSLSLYSDRGEEIDFSPRLLQKEIGILLYGEEFRMQELQLPDSIAGINPGNGKYFTITGTEGEKLLAYVGRVHCCRAGGCTDRVINGMDGDYEYFDYFILFDSKKTVKVVRVYNYEATHGQEIMVRSWLNQFIGFDGTKSLRIGKEIDSISGATISVAGLVADVQAKSNFINRHLY